MTIDKAIMIRNVSNYSNDTFSTSVSVLRSAASPGTGKSFIRALRVGRRVRRRFGGGSSAALAVYY